MVKETAMPGGNHRIQQVYRCVTKQLTNPLLCYIYLLRVPSTSLLLRNKTANQSTVVLHLLTESTVDQSTIA
jgi:hypothetical protein